MSSSGLCLGGAERRSIELVNAELVELPVILKQKKFKIPISQTEPLIKKYFVGL